MRIIPFNYIATIKPIMHTADVCTTQKAAEILGISVTSVQQLVEAGVIEAWKTKGGHRRIPLAAVEAYKGNPGQPGQDQRAARASRPAPSGRPPSILVIEDNPIERALYEKQIGSWGLQADLRFCENGYQALMEIARDQPDILLADIVMEGIDGYEVIRTILADPLLADMHIAMLSSLTQEELEERGGVPPGVVFFAKPVNYDELRGYLRACCAGHARRHSLAA
ncbi:DNA binding domain-containing protein, excisionase family [Janthinobacterium sp. OK676]|nr:excisionase family DNA binding protein [Janthinobacterium sp. 67]SDN51484.1 DNA binding domain-containing protein, excisionase family [Janthinobacterium sp. OK676]